MKALLQPEPMQRTLILASKGYQERVIETLHRLRVAHLIEFHEGKGPEFEGFAIGKPLPAASGASARLVRIRALLRHAGLEGAEPQRTLAVRDLEARLESHLDVVERDLTRASELREQLKQRIQESHEVEVKLRPLTALPLRLEDYRGYDTLQPFVGRADPAFEAEVQRLSPDALLVKGTEGGLFALFVPKAQAPAVSEVLYRHGYAEVEVPEGTGTPDERLGALAEERAALQRQAEQAERDLARLAAEHRDFLLAAEEHLSILVEKAEAPLSFATTEHAFVVDAWIPLRDVWKVEGELRKVTGDNLHFITVETDAHGHDDHHAGADAQAEAHAGGDHHKAPAAVEPPTKYANPGPAKPYEFFTELFATPRYNEIDPTAVFAVFFPLFFGFMVGDLGLGLLIAALGVLMVRKLSKVDGMRQLGIFFITGGLIAAAFGGIVFKDALGIPLGVTHHMEEELVHAGIADPTCMDIYVHVHEPTWTCLFQGGSAHVHHEAWADPMVSKVTDVTTMLLLSVAAAFVHLFVGLLIGLKNEWGHGAKHFGAKVGYMVLLLGFFPAVLALLGGPLGPLTTTQAYMIAGVALALGGVILGWAEGIAGIVELPSMFTALLSYLRLGAVGIAKGAMAVAFNSMTLVAALTGGGLILVLGLFGFLVAQTALLVLGILSGGIQALRLNFVEFFTKFYKGGGKRYAPFGRERQHTTAAASAPSPSTP